MSLEKAGPLHALPLFTDTNVLPFNFLYYQSKSNLMRDVHNNKVPSGILNLLKKQQQQQLVATPTTQEHRLQKFVYFDSSDLELYKLSFSRFGAKLWNEIPCHIQHIPKNKFRKTQSANYVLIFLIQKMTILIRPP